MLWASWRSYSTARPWRAELANPRVYKQINGSPLRGLKVVDTDILLLVYRIRLTGIGWRWTRIDRTLNLPNHWVILMLQISALTHVSFLQVLTSDQHWGDICSLRWAWGELTQSWHVWIVRPTETTVQFRGHCTVSLMLFSIDQSLQIRRF